MMELGSGVRVGLVETVLMLQSDTGVYSYIIYTLFIHYLYIIYTLFIHYSYIIHTLFIH